jgi:hypothetical protein
VPPLLEPELGPDRIVCLLPPGVAARLSFDRLAHELGNGWADLTLPIVQGADDWQHVLLPEFAEPVDLLTARWRPLFVIGDGDVMRSPLRLGGWAYRVFVDDQWHDCRVIRLAECVARPAPSTVRRREQRTAARTAAGNPDGRPLLGVVEAPDPE